MINEQYVIYNTPFADVSSQITSVTFGDEVETIPAGLCEGMSITSITIPGSVKKIEDYAFNGCESLVSVHISDIAAWCGIDFNGSSNPLSYAEHLYIDNKEVTSLVVPNGVTSISNTAFRNAKSLTTVTLPASVSSIGDYAFAGCSAVKRFYSYATNPPAVSENAIENYNAYLYVPCSSLEDYDLHNVWGNFKHIECIPEEATAINTVSSDKQGDRVRKTDRNGVLYIERNGKIYTVTGRIVDAIGADIR